MLQTMPLLPTHLHFLKQKMDGHLHLYYSNYQNLIDKQNLYHYRNSWPCYSLYLYVGFITSFIPYQRKVKYLMTDSKAALSQVKSRIKEAVKQAGKASDVFQIDFSEIKIGKFTPEIKKAIQACSNAQAVYFAECDLTSLQNIPILKKLQQLDVSSNSLTDADLKIIASNFKDLIRLSIGDNSISKLQSLKTLKNLQLQSFDCDDNPISKSESYTKTAFETFKTLKYLDNKDKDGKQMIEDQDVNGEQEGQDGKLDEGEQQDQEAEQEQGQEEDGSEQEPEQEEGGEEQEQEQSQQEQKPKKKKR